MKKLKKTTALLATFALTFGLMPSSVSADDDIHELSAVSMSDEIYQDEVNSADDPPDEDSGISIMSLLPLDRVTGTVNFDRSGELLSDVKFDCTFKVQDVFDSLIADGTVAKADVEGKRILYSVNDDDFEEVTGDSVQEASPSYSSYGGYYYSKVFFLVGNADQFDISNKRYEIELRFRFYADGGSHEVHISRTDDASDGLQDSPLYSFYVKEALYNVLNEQGRLDANGNFGGNILYSLSGDYLYTYTSTDWNGIISPYSTYFYTAFDNPDEKYCDIWFIAGPDSVKNISERYRIRVYIGYAGKRFINELSVKIYNGSQEVKTAGQRIYERMNSYNDSYRLYITMSDKSFNTGDTPGILIDLPDSYSTDSVAVYKGLIYSTEQLTSAENITSQLLVSKNPYKLSFDYDYPQDYKGSKLCTLEATYVITGTSGFKTLVPVTHEVMLCANNFSITTLAKSDSWKYNIVYFPFEDGSGEYYSSYYPFYYTDSLNKLQIALGGVYYDYIDENYNGTGDDTPAKIEHAFVGYYESEEEALAAGAKDIKEQLFSTAGLKVNASDCKSVTAYEKDLKTKINMKQVCITVIDTYGMVHNSYYTFGATTKENTEYSGTGFSLYGAMSDTDGEKERLASYSVSEDSYFNIDSYNGYKTEFILNRDGTPVTNGTVIYPYFSSSKGSVVHREGDSSPQISEESPLTFESGKAVQYTVGAENGKNRSNYWVTFVTRQQGGAKLFVNGINNKAHWNEERNIPQREIFFTRYENYHDIFIANIGDEELTGISVTLSPDTQGVKLDNYWTVIDGSKSCLAPFTSVDAPDNIAKIRLVPSDDTFGGIISGTLTISSANGGSYDIDLTGIAGIPQIITEDIYNGVKYVPYSCVIMTNCMYGNNGMKFEINNEYISDSGLPEGVRLYENGLIYGVPKEAGYFLFGVKATYTSGFNSKFYRDTTFDLGTVYYTLVIADNTDENVDGVNTDSFGYELNQRVSREITVYYSGTDMGDDPYTYMEAHANEDYTFNAWDVIYDSDLFWSQGELDDFKAFYLDGDILSEADGDYSSESGSTKITVNDQTFRPVIGSPSDTRHTLAAEFKQDGTPEIKRSAQNFTVNYVYNNDDQGEDPSGGQGEDQGGNQGGNSSSTSGTGNLANEISISEELGSADFNMTITDKNGNPLQGLQIELHSTSRHGTTDSSGQVKFDGVEFGKHTLYITDPVTGKERSKSFTVVSGSGVKVKGSVITAVNGSTVNLAIEFDGKNITFAETEDVSSGASIYDSPDTTPNIVFYMLPAVIIFAIAAATVTYIRRRLEK